MLQIWYSCGSRTSISTNLSPRSIFAFTSIDVDFAFVHFGLLALRLLMRDAAELLVVDQLGDRRMIAADRAFGILAQLQLAERMPSAS